VHDEDGGRDIPEFVLQGTGKEEEEDGDLEELFEAGTGRNNGKGYGIRDTGYGISIGRLEEKCGWFFYFERPTKEVFEDPGAGCEDLVCEPVGGFEIDLGVVKLGG